MNLYLEKIMQRIFINILIAMMEMNGFILFTFYINTFFIFF